MRISAPFSKRDVQAVSVFSTRSHSSRQMKCMSRLRPMAPGRRPASQRIWKPLQMPSTGIPPRAAVMTSPMTGAMEAMAPQRR